MPVTSGRAESGGIQYAAALVFDPNGPQYWITRFRGR